MKKLLILLLLILSPVTANAQKNDYSALCTDIAIRYTVFAMLARDFDNKSDYEAMVYKSLSQSNASSDTREILMKLIEFAWLMRGEDVTSTANLVYQSCVKGEAV